MSLLSAPLRPAEPYQYDPAKRRLAKSYRNSRLILEVISDPILQIGFCLFFLVTGLSSALWRASVSLGVGNMVAGASYVFAFLAVMMVVQMPVAWYGGYAVEHRFGLSRQTVSAWLLDFGKVALLGFVIVVPISVGLYYLIPLSPVWWLWASLVYAGLEIVASTILPFVVVPMFYKLKPYENMEHRNQLLNMAQKAGAKNIQRVMLVNESARSGKANAFFTGIGNTRTMVLFDNLVSGFTPREVLTVVAHELAHYVNKDIWRGAALSIVLTIPELYVANTLLQWFTGSFGISGPSDPTGFPLILAALSIVGFALMPFSNGISRILERQADEFALRVAEEPDAQASTERRLADMNLSDDKPHWLVEMMFYTHPPPWKRVKLAEEWKLRNSR